MTYLADDESRLSGILQLDLTNAYFFHGILNERDGLIAQPWAELYVSLYSAEDGPIRDVTLGAGVWTSIHSEETLAADSPESVYETDWYPLLSVGVIRASAWRRAFRSRSFRARGPGASASRARDSTSATPSRR